MFGWPVLVHYCSACGYNTPVEYSAAVWNQAHTCTHCGNSSPGADIAGESKGAMNSAQHDELAQLFARNMHLSQSQQAAMVDYKSQMSQQKRDSPISFASAHYTQTAHVRGDTQSEPSRSPPPPYYEAAMPEAMAEMLREHSIDPCALLPNQIKLFLNANYEQRLRLLELWRISPPSYPLEQHMHEQWTATSVENEEQAARERYEQQIHAGRGQQAEEMLDTATTQPISLIRQPGEPHWPPAARIRAASIAAGQASLRQAEVEPYIVNGYEIAASARAVEPIYAAAGLWRETCHSIAPQQQQKQPTMEDQYGMYEQIRNHADWERMNEQMARENFIALHGSVSMDDDMVL